MTTRHLLFRSEGETGADLSTELEGVTLSTLGGVTIDCRRPDGKKLSKPMIIDDDAGGLFHIEWAAGDLIPGDMPIEYVITDAGGDVNREPDPERSVIVIRVRKKI